MFVEFFQIIWFTFIAETAWHGFTFTVFLNAFQLNFNLSFFAWFWIFAGYAILVLIVVLIFVCCCDMNDDSFIIVGVVFLTMVPIFQPLMIKMMQALVCTYPLGASPTLDVDVVNHMTCWTGLHILYSVVAFIIIIFFYPAISITMAVLVGGKSDRTVWIAFLVIQFKMVQVFFYAFFSTYILAFLLCLLGVNATFLLAALWMPTSHEVLRILRIIAMALALWAVVPTLVAFGMDEINNWTSVGLLIAGWVLIPIIAVAIWYYRRHKREQREKDLHMQPAYTEPPPQVQPAGPSQPTIDIQVQQANAYGQPPQGYPPPGPYGQPPQGYPPGPYPNAAGPYPNAGPFAPHGNIPVVIGVPQGQPHPPMPPQMQPQPAYPIDNDD